MKKISVERNKDYPSLSKKITVLLILVFISFSLGSVFGYFSRPLIHWRVKKLVTFLNEVSLSDLRVCLCQPDKDIKLKRDDGLTIAGSLYGLTNQQKRPGILILHGNSPLGRKLPLYEVLAKKLSDRGYSVLTIDFAGYGESHDPFSLDTKEALGHDKEVYAALRYMEDLDSINKDQIYVIGHSGGAGSALRIGIKEKTIKKIVLIGPPRRVTERLLNQHDRDYFWKRAQRTREIVYKKPFPVWYTKDFWLEKTLKSDIRKYIPHLSQPSHKPVFLIDGARESTNDKIYLLNFYTAITEPKKYLTLPRADHYCNTFGMLGINFYDISVINKTVEEIVAWLKM